MGDVDEILVRRAALCNRQELPFVILESLTIARISPSLALHTSLSAPIVTGRRTNRFPVSTSVSAWNIRLTRSCSTTVMPSSASSARSPRASATVPAAS